MAALEKSMKQTVIVMMILGAALSRLIPHVPNVTAVTAIALLGGAYLSNRMAAVLVPVAALFLSDLILNFHSTMLFVYSAVAVIGFVSTYLLKDSTQWSKLAVVSLVSSLFFFVVTNFGVWMMESFYPKTWDGLVSCYVMALPFFGTQALGDLFYTGVLFGSVAVLRAWTPGLFEIKAS